MNLETEKIREQQLDDLMNLINNIDPKNRIFNKPKNNIEKNKYQLYKKKFNEASKQRKGVK